jgi:hypothetical protein
MNVSGIRNCSPRNSSICSLIVHATLPSAFCNLIYAFISAAYHTGSCHSRTCCTIKHEKIYISIYIQRVDPSHNIYGHTGGLTHQSNYIMLCHRITVSTNVEPCCDVVLNIVLEVVPEDDACVETRWTITCFKFES